MYTGQMVFSQLMDFLPRHEFNQCVRRYQGSYRVCKYSCLDQFLCPVCLPPRRQVHRPAQRSENPTSRAEYVSSLSRYASPHQLRRCRYPETLGLLDQQLHPSGPDHCPPVQVPLAGGAVLQVDQAVPADQGLFSMSCGNWIGSIPRTRHRCRSRVRFPVKAKRRPPRKSPASRPARRPTVVRGNRYLQSSSGFQSCRTPGKLAIRRSSVRTSKPRRV